jgi:hypothetical protein
VSPVIAAFGKQDLRDPTKFKNGETFNILGSRKNPDSDHWVTHAECTVHWEGFIAIMDTAQRDGSD